VSDLRTLLTGLAFGESPRWHKGRLWFCNWCFACMLGGADGRTPAGRSLA
jgi:hypothetical protein